MERSTPLYLHEKWDSVCAHIIIIIWHQYTYYYHYCYNTAGVRVVVLCPVISFVCAACLAGFLCRVCIYFFVVVVV